jgi:hypothetical protein
MRRIILVTALLIASCTTLVPQAQKIRVTDKSEEVANCQILGTVHSHPPYVMPSDGENQLRNNAAVLGADTLFLTSTGALRGMTGMAYRCSASGPAK